MAKKTVTPPSGGKGKSTGGSPVSECELIVIAMTDVGLRATPSIKERVVSSVGADVTPLSELLRSEDVTLQPLFGLSEERMIDPNRIIGGGDRRRGSRPFWLLPY